MKKQLNKLLYLSGAALLAACSISRDLPVPKDAAPAIFRNAPSNDTASMAELPWKTFFAQQQLRQLIDSAIARNYDMQLALKNIEKAALLNTQRKWNNIPQIGLDIKASSSNPSDNSLSGQTTRSFLGAGHLEDYSATLSLSWEADIWGKIRNQNRAQAAEYLKTKEARSALQTSIVAQVASSYYTLLMLDEQLVIANQNLERTGSTLKVIQLQYQAGQVSLLALQQAQAQHLYGQQLLPAISSEIQIQEHALSVLTGSFPGPVSRAKLEQDNKPNDNLQIGLPAAMVSRRADVREKEAGLILANAMAGAAKARLYPSLNISASAGLNAIQASDWFNMPGSLFASMAAGLSQPLLQHKKMQTGYKTSLIEREKSVLEFRKTVLTAVTEVSNALVNLEQKNKESLLLSQRVDTLKKATANAKMLFESGSASYLEVLSAQGHVLEAELELSAIENGKRRALSELYRSLGGGWK